MENVSLIANGSAIARLFGRRFPTIMNTNSFFPLAEAGQIIVWLSHYALKLPTHDPVCGISADEITGTLADITCYIWLMQHWHPAVQRDAKESTSFKRHIIDGSGDSIPYPQSFVFPNPPPMAAPGIKKRLFNQIARIKANPSYTEVIGHDLGFFRHRHEKPYYDESPLTPGNTPE
jgi:hypothetical protein